MALRPEHLVLRPRDKDAYRLQDLLLMEVLALEHQPLVHLMVPFDLQAADLRDMASLVGYTQVAEVLQELGEGALVPT